MPTSYKSIKSKKKIKITKHKSKNNKKTKKGVKNLKIMLVGISSSGKSSIMNAFPKNFKKYSMDELMCDSNCYGKDEKYKGIKNKYYTDNKMNEIWNNYITQLIMKKFKNSNNWLYDYVWNGKKTFEHKNLPVDRKNVLVYTNFKDLVSNMKKRLPYDPRSQMVFEQFANYYVKTTNKNESIDNINLKDFIKELKKIKLLFSSEKDLITFAKKIFKKMKIKDDANSSTTHYIKSRYTKYDLIVKTNGKTPDECKDYILKNLI